MTGADVEASIRGIALRLEAALRKRGATLELDLAGDDIEVEARLHAPLLTILLSLARYARPGQPFVIRTRVLAGADAELVVESLDLPDDFPDSLPERDLWRLADDNLWRLADDMLNRYHRARLAHMPDRVLMLVPSKGRARKLCHDGF